MMYTTTFDFFGIKIAATNLNLTVSKIINYDFTTPSYVSFPDTYVVALSTKDKRLQNIINSAYMAMPDGKPSEFYAKRKGFKNVSTVSGFWLCKNLLETQLTHYFLGSDTENIQKMVTELHLQHPNAKILGYKSPPMVTQSEIDTRLVFANEFEEINRLKPDLIWIGLSSPKQDYIIASHIQLLDQGLMLGVGGVFDYLSGRNTKSPEWVKKLGLRWLWRLGKEPQRLFYKYYFTVKTLGVKYLIKIIKNN